MKKKTGGKNSITFFLSPSLFFLYPLRSYFVHCERFDSSFNGLLTDFVAVVYSSTSLLFFDGIFFPPFCYYFCLIQINRIFVIAFARAFKGLQTSILYTLHIYTHYNTFGGGRLYLCVCMF